MESEHSPGTANSTPLPPTLQSQHSAPAVPPALPPPPPPPPPRRRSSSSWIVWGIIGGGLLMLFLLGSLFMGTLRGLMLPSTAGATGRHGLQEVVLRNEDSRHKIALIELNGIISSRSFDRSGYSMVDYVRHQLDSAADDPRVRAVVLSIDSPGGEVLAADEIYHALTEFQKDHDKPVVASMQSLAASGGYYDAAPCRWIVAHELTLTGSIGVILHAYNYRGLFDKVGVRPEVYKSGRFKDMLSGEKLEEEISPEERRMLQELVDESFARFKRVVLEGRSAAALANKDQGRPLAEEWASFADGRILSGQQAFDQGFVDELGNLDTAIERAKRLAKISDANLVQYRRVFDLGNLFRLLGRAEPATVKVDLGMDLPLIQPGRLYFLAPALMQ